MGVEEEQGPEEEGALETSLEELLQRRDRRTEEDDDPDEEALLEAMEGREGPAEALTVRVVPPQPTEFTCRKCFLLKHQSQLADKRKVLCRDCA